MVSLGLRDAGYEYLILDDAWSERNRTPDGKLVGNYARFPSGMKALGDYGPQVWHIFGCGAPNLRGLPRQPRPRGGGRCDVGELGGRLSQGRYCVMRDALNKTGRPMVYSLCSWGVGDPWLWGPKVGHSWRTTMDIDATYVRPGGWNDLDMLEVGNFPQSEFYYRHVERSHFALWALLKSPLLVGADLRRISPASLAVLKAREVIGVNQDALGVAGELIWKQGPKEASGRIYAAPLSGGRRAVALFSRHTHKTQASMVGYDNATRVRVRDLYAAADLGIHDNNFTASVGIHDVALLSLTPLEAGVGHDAWRPWHGQPLFEPHEEDGSWIGRGGGGRAARTPTGPAGGAVAGCGVGAEGGGGAERGRGELAAGVPNA
eukprot:scaffold3.g6556.t1